MARVSNWRPQKFDKEFLNASMDRLVKAAHIVKDNAEVLCPVGTVSRPMYKRGPYAGKDWTKRDAGQLKKSIRVSEKYGARNDPINEPRNVRIYAGTRRAYYAQIVEYAVKKFLRPALNKSKSKVRSILENG